MSSEPKPPAESAVVAQAKQTPGPSSSKVNLAVVAGLAALVAVAIAYGVGRMQVAPKLRQAEAAVSSATQAAKAAHAKAQAEHSRVLRLEARRRFDLALLALDDRNFGIAQTDLKAAAALIHKSAPSADSDLAKLEARVEKMNLTVTQDLASERNQLVELIRRFDQIVPPLKIN